MKPSINNLVLLGIPLLLNTPQKSSACMPDSYNGRDEFEEGRFNSRLSDDLRNPSQEPKSLKEIKTDPKREVGGRLGYELGTVMGGLSTGVAAALLRYGIGPWIGSPATYTAVLSSFAIGAYVGGTTYGNIGGGIGDAIDNLFSPKEP